MTTISAKQVMELRERTGSGMMECKKFLQQANGDIEKAIIEMRKAGQAKADKKSDRVAAEGVIVIAVKDDNREAVMLEINSETDFVARDANFTLFAKLTAQTCLATNINDVEALKSIKLHGDSNTVEEARQHLVAKIGENVQLRRIVRVKSEKGVVGTYLHGARIGVLVAISTTDLNVAKDIAMHVAASRPLVVQAADVSPEVIANERAIFEAQAKDSGKPEAIIKKMVDGRMQKFLSDVSLVGQAFVKNPDITVEAFLKEKASQVTQFVRFEVGEGIEKKQDNFVAEVMAQVRE
ncbi:MAG: translation elongation factor Ts [Legionellales bacterium RIFCSPHIGHO2_12_FULL_37_14]|nr:MAG: translation elongation factor Ts [Legionellales bacterium RIFCSPHIGHO2_12_FULL_37_14]